MSYVIYQRSDVRCQMPDVRCQMSDVRCQMLNIRCPKSDVRCQISDILCQISDFICQIIYIRYHMLDFIFQMSVFSHLSDTVCQMPDSEVRFQESDVYMPFVLLWCSTPVQWQTLQTCLILSVNFKFSVSHPLIDGILYIPL